MQFGKNAKNLEQNKMHWIHSTFKQYCEKNGYLLLHDDFKYIENALRCIPTHKQRPLMFEYCNVWNHAMLIEPDSNKRQSVGRRAANNFLLQHKEKEI